MKRIEKRLRELEELAGKEQEHPDIVYVFEAGNEEQEREENQKAIEEYEREQGVKVDPEKVFLIATAICY